MNIRIFRQPTKDMQPNGEWHIDTLQFQEVHVYKSLTTEGISGIEVSTVHKSEWEAVPIVEADSYLKSEGE